MTSTTKKKAALIAGSATLAFAGAAAYLPAVALAAQPDGGQAADAVQQDAQETAATGLETVRNVQGAFSFTQDEVTPNGTISGVFNRAAAAVCASLPTYVSAVQDLSISVGGSAAGNEFVGTVDEMASEEGAKAFLMACSCASNVAGGGAIANAEVSGVSLESIARAAGVTL